MTANENTKVQYQPLDHEADASLSASHSIATRPSKLSVYDRIVDASAFIREMGKSLYESKMFGCHNVAMGQALMFGFMVKRIDPFDFVRRHDIIGGKVSMKSATMLADFRTKAGGSHRVVSRTPDKAAIELKLGREKELFAFTWEEAQDEDYVYTTEANAGRVPKRLPDGTVNPKALKDNWSTPRRRMQMLWSRVVSDAVRSVAPEINYGEYTPEELGGPADEVRDDDVVDVEFSAAEAKTAPATVNDQEEPPVVATPTVEAARSVEASPARTLSAEAASLLQRIKPLKERLLTAEQWSRVLAKYGVAKASLMTVAQLATLAENLEARQAKLAATTPRDELSAWADSALQGKPKN